MDKLKLTLTTIEGEGRFAICVGAVLWLLRIVGLAILIYSGANYAAYIPYLNGAVQCVQAIPGSP